MKKYARLDMDVAPPARKGFMETRFDSVAWVEVLGEAPSYEQIEAREIQHELENRGIQTKLIEVAGAELYQTRYLVCRDD